MLRANLCERIKRFFVHTHTPTHTRAQERKWLMGCSVYMCDHCSTKFGTLLEWRSVPLLPNSLPYGAHNLLKETIWGGNVVGPLYIYIYAQKLSWRSSYIISYTGHFYYSNHHKWLPYQILNSKTNPYTTEIRSTKLNVTLWVTSI